MFPMKTKHQHSFVKIKLNIVKERVFDNFWENGLKSLLDLFNSILNEHIDFVIHF